MHPLTLATLITCGLWAVCLAVLLLARHEADRRVALIFGCAMSVCFAVMAMAG